jgi:hypothetical protein
VLVKPSSNGRDIVFQRLGAYAIERVEQLADVAEINDISVVEELSTFLP